MLKKDEEEEKQLLTEKRGNQFELCDFIYRLISAYV